MNTYLFVKTLHILSSVLMVGMACGSGFYLFFVNRTKSVPVIAAVCRLVTRADLWLSTPATLFQPLSGIWLMHMAGWSWDTPWLLASVLLYLIAVLFWLPAMWLVIQMRRIAAEAVAQEHNTLPPIYWRYARLWECHLGCPGFLAMVAIYFMMVPKPTFS